MSLHTLANNMASGGEASSVPGHLREIDILNQYFRKANIAPEQGLKLIDAAIQGGSKFTRRGNTLMAYKPIGPNAAQIYFFSVDDPRAFAQIMGKLFAELAQAGIQTIYMNKVDPTIVAAMQEIKVKTQQSDKPEYKIMAQI
jgi:hypothetical protein